MFQDDELLNEFVIESLEHLSDIEGQFLQIEALGANVDVDLVNTVFRAIHSVKGAAGFLGLTNINALAHSLENVLNMVRNSQLVPTSVIVNTMLRSADLLRTMIEDIASATRSMFRPRLPNSRKYNRESWDRTSRFPNPKVPVAVMEAPSPRADFAENTLHNAEVIVESAIAQDQVVSTPVAPSPSPRRQPPLPTNRTWLLPSGTESKTTGGGGGGSSGAPPTMAHPPKGIKWPSRASA